MPKINIPIRFSVFNQRPVGRKHFLFANLKRLITNANPILPSGFCFQPTSGQIQTIRIGYFKISNSLCIPQCFHWVVSFQPTSGHFQNIFTGHFQMSNFSCQKRYPNCVTSFQPAFGQFQTHYICHNQASDLFMPTQIFTSGFLFSTSVRSVSTNVYWPFSNEEIFMPKIMLPPRFSVFNQRPGNPNHSLLAIIKCQSFTAKLIFPPGFLFSTSVRSIPDPFYWPSSRVEFILSETITQ